MPVSTNNNTNKKIAYLQGWISITVNGLLFILKYWAGFVTGSLALMADAWHTLSDSLSSIIVLIGTKISNKPPDKDHPFGLCVKLVGICPNIVKFATALKTS